MTSHDLANVLDDLYRKAEQTDDDIAYYSGGSTENMHANQLLDVVITNMPIILESLRAYLP